jgi:hypothetical protein
LLFCKLVCMFINLPWQIQESNIVILSSFTLETF